MLIFIVDIFLFLLIFLEESIMTMLQITTKSASQLHNHIIAQCLGNSKETNSNQLNFPFMKQMPLCYKKNRNKAQKIIKKKRLINNKKSNQLQVGFLENIQ